MVLATGLLAGGACPASALSVEDAQVLKKPESAPEPPEYAQFKGNRKPGILAPPEYAAESSSEGAPSNAEPVVPDELPSEDAI